MRNPRIMILNGKHPRSLNGKHPMNQRKQLYQLQGQLYDLVGMRNPRIMILNGKHPRSLNGKHPRSLNGKHPRNQRKCNHTETKH
jgi:hypothetical protein